MKNNVDNILRLDNPFNLKEVLTGLIDATDILLHKRDYDGHGWEHLEYCFRHAKDIVTEIDKYLAAASTVTEATDKNLVFKLSVFLGTRLDPNKKPMTFLANEIVEAFLLNKQPEQEIPIWYREDDMRAWLIHNQYAEQIATELAAIWARDLQGAFKKGWEKAKNDGKAGTFDYEYMKEPLGQCMAGRDTECNHPKCPVTDEDARNGRYCTLPLYDWRQ